MQPRSVSAPTSQWAIIATSATINTARQPAVLGRRTPNPSYADDSLIVPSMTNGGYNAGGNSQPRVTVLSPDLTQVTTVSVAGNNNTVLPWTAAQGDDTVWLATDDGSVNSSLVSINGRSQAVSPESRIQQYAGTPIREFQGMVAVDDTLYVGSQIGTFVPQQSGISAVPTSAPTAGSVIPSSYTNPFKAAQLAKSVIDDTVIAAGQVLAGSSNCRSLATSPSQGTSTTFQMPWCSRGAAGGQNLVYVGQGPDTWDSYQPGAPGNGLAAVNPRNLDDSTIATIAGGGQFWGMSAWPNASSDDTVFVADQSKRALWVIRGGRTLTADDSVMFSLNCGVCTPYYVTAARPDLVYATVYEAGWDARVNALGVVSGQTVPSSSGTALTGVPDDSITIALTLPQLFTQNAALVTDVWIDDSVTTRSALVRQGNTITAKVPAGSGGPYSVIVGLNGGNRIEVGKFRYTATATFDANGGTGTMTPQSSATPAPLAANAFTRSGYTFAGWNTAANGSGTPYADQSSFPFAANATLYAQWTAAPVPPPPTPPGMTPESQIIRGLVGRPITPTSTFTLSHFSMPVTYSVYPTLPRGLTIDPATGVVAGVPEIAATTRHWITAAAAGNAESAYSTLDITIEDAPPPPPPPPVTREVVLDPGERIRGPGRGLDRITTTGTTAGIVAGTRLTPYIKYAGQQVFAQGRATILVASDGSFRWTREIRRNKAVTAYVAYEDVKSNEVVWARLR